MKIKLRKFFSRYFFLLFLINISVFHQSKQSDTQNENDINNGFKPIRTLIDFSIIDVLGTFDFDIEDYKKVLNETIQALSKLLYVQPITEANPIKLNFDNYPELNIPRNILNGKLINGTSNVLLAELMMVGEVERRDVRNEWREVVLQLLWRTNARKQEGVVVRQFAEHLSPSATSLEDGLQGVVVERREEEPLVGIETHGFGDDAILHRLHVLRTFRHDDDVGTVLALERFAQAPCG